MHEDGFVMGSMTLFSTVDKNHKLLTPTGTLNVPTGSLPMIPAQNVTATPLPTPPSCWDIHPLPPPHKPAAPNSRLLLCISMLAAALLNRHLSSRNLPH